MADMSVSPTEKPQVDGGEDLEIEFDKEKALSYLNASTCLTLPLVSSCLCLPCVFCIPCWQRRELETLHCKITDRRIEYEGGWLNHVSKNIPLDRIQDIAIDQGCCQRYFGIKGLSVQTAGSGGPVPEMYLLAPKNPEMIRDTILQRRDRLVLGNRAANGLGAPGSGALDDISRNTMRLNVANNVGKSGGTTGAAGTHTVQVGAASGVSDKAVVLEIRELKEAVLRIEKQLAVGLERVDKQ